jgi:hypothetical protein
VRRLTTRDLSDRHEEFLAATFGGRRTPGSGNQFNKQMDVRDSPDTPIAMAWDGKATLGKSIGVTRDMWQKAREQAGAEMPALALRWYGSERLDPALDLVVLDAHDFAGILVAAREYERAKECLRRSYHVTKDRPPERCEDCGMLLYIQEG